MDKIYGMKLHDILHQGDYEILRVPGGWVYTRFSDTGAGGYSQSSTFVRFGSDLMSAHQGDRHET